MCNKLFVMNYCLLVVRLAEAYRKKKRNTPRNLNLAISLFKSFEINIFKSLFLNQQKLQLKYAAKMTLQQNIELQNKETKVFL